jgi:nicotinamidase-related amidase
VTQADPTRQSALLVIDVQADLFAEPQAVYDGPAVLARISGVIEQARRADVSVVFVQDDDVAPVGSEGWEVHPALDVKPSDLRIQKAYADAFYQTCLLEELQRRGVQRLVVVGCTTDACIDATCRGAVSLSFDVVLVSDAHTTKDNRFLSAAQSIEYYNLVLDGFGAEDSVGKGEHEVMLAAADDNLFPPAG